MRIYLFFLGLLQFFAFCEMAKAAEIEKATVYHQPAYDVNKPPFAIAYTPEQKEVQVAAGKSLIADIQNALKSGQTSYTIALGVYRIPDRQISITQNNFTLDGSGSTLILTGGTGVLGSAHGCSNLTIKNLIIDADPLVWTQGVITAYDNSTGAFQARLMPGYPTQMPAKISVTPYTPNGKYFTDFPQWRQSTNTTVSGSTVSGTVDAGKPQYYAVGNLIVFHIHGNRTFHTWAVSGLTFSNVTSDMDCLFGDGGSTSGNYLISNLHGMRDPDTNRLVSNLAFAASCRNGDITYDNCQFGGGQDDALDSGGNGFQGIVSVSGSTMQVLSSSWQKLPFYVGDTLNIYDHQHMGLRYSAKITEVSEITDSAAVSNAVVTYKKFKIAQSTSSKLYSLTLDSPINADAGDFVEDVTRGKQGTFTMNNCYWFNDANAVNAEGFNIGRFTNNTFEHINSGLSIGSAPWWWEGPFPQNITVTGNTFKACGYDWKYRGAPAYNTGGTALWIGPYWNGAASNTGKYAINNVLVSDNTFTDSVEYALSVLNCNNGTVRNNAITNSTGGGIIAAGSGNVIISGNSIAGCHGPTITAHYCNGIAITGNTLTGPGDTVAIEVDWDTNLTVSGNVAKSFNSASRLVGGLSSSGLPDNAVVQSASH